MDLKDDNFKANICSWVKKQKHFRTVHTKRDKTRNYVLFYLKKYQFIKLAIYVIIWLDYWIYLFVVIIILNSNFNIRIWSKSGFTINRFQYNRLNRIFAKVLLRHANSQKFKQVIFEFLGIFLLSWQWQKYMKHEFISVF